MANRYHCVFKNCTCRGFHQNCNNLCLYCNHANIWHSSIESPPSDDYLSFVSPRDFARRPVYEKRHLIINIIKPEVPPLPLSDDEIPYCTAIEILPV